MVDFTGNHDQAGRVGRGVDFAVGDGLVMEPGTLTAREAELCDYTAQLARLEAAWLRLAASWHDQGGEARRYAAELTVAMTRARWPQGTRACQRSE